MSTLNKLVDAIDDIYGQYRWTGSDSYVWKIGERFIIKATCVRLSEWRTMRILQNRNGPFAKIIDMHVFGLQRVDGQCIIADDEHPFIVGFVVQEFVADYNDDDIAPITWNDGTDAWLQTDPNDDNAKGVVWVDLTAIVEATSMLSMMGHPRKVVSDASLVAGDEQE